MATGRETKGRFPMGSSRRWFAGLAIVVIAGGAISCSGGGDEDEGSAVTSTTVGADSASPGTAPSLPAGVDMDQLNEILRQIEQTQPPGTGGSGQPAGPEEVDPALRAQIEKYIEQLRDAGMGQGR